MSVYIAAELRRQIRAQFGDCCAYCHTAESLTVAIFEIEHIIPRSVGGQTVIENLCLSCPTCNRFKSDRTIGLPPDALSPVRLFHPQQDAWREHFEWNSEATELIGQTEIANVTIETLRINRPQLIRVRRMWVAMNEHPPSIF